MASNSSCDGDALDSTANNEIHGEHHTDENVHKDSKRKDALAICILIVFIPIAAPSIVLWTAFFTGVTLYHVGQSVKDRIRPHSDARAKKRRDEAVP